MKNKLPIYLALAGAAALGAVVTAISAAQSDSAGTFSGKQKQEINEIIRTYIEENPDVILEALNSYIADSQSRDEERMAELGLQTAKDNLKSLISTEYGHVVGKNIETAQVSVIEFYDYHCGFCKRMTGEMKKLATEDPDVKVFFRELPVLSDQSVVAAEYALAAAKQDKYTEFHFALMSEQGTLTEERILDVAKSIGVDVDQLKSDYENGSEDSIRIFDENFRIADSVEQRATPLFFVVTDDGSYANFIPGARQDDLMAAIKEAKKAAKKQRG
jgi:protein-disulfide isomerase